MNLIEYWKEGIENIFQLHGPEMALQAISVDNEENREIPYAIREIAKASIFYRGANYDEAEKIINTISNEIKELELVYQAEWQVIAIGVHVFYNRYQEALKILEESIKVNPNNLDLYNQLAYVQDKLGIKSYSISYPELLKKFNDHYEVKIEYASYLFYRKENDKAKEIALEVIEKDPNNVKALDILGYIALENMEDQKAYDYLIKSSEIWPFNKKRLQSLANIALLNRDKDGEEKAYRYALQFYKTDGEFNLKLLTILLNTPNRDTNEVIELGNKVLQYLPDNVRSYFLCAYAYYLGGKIQDANNILKECYAFKEIPQGVYELQEKINTILKK